MSKKTKYELIKSLDIYSLEDEYKPSNDIFDEDDILYKKLKKIIQDSLDDTEKRILFTYAELGNYRDTAKVFSVSTTTIFNKIRDIRIKIIKFLYLPSSFDATNFLTNVKNPEQSTMKQTIIANKNKFNNVIIYIFVCF